MILPVAIFCINLGDRTQICLINKLQRFPFNQNLGDWLCQSQGGRKPSSCFAQAITASSNPSLSNIKKYEVLHDSFGGNKSEAEDSTPHLKTVHWTVFPFKR